MIENIIYLLAGALVGVIGQNFRIRKLKTTRKYQHERLASLRFELKQEETFSREQSREIEALRQILKYRNETIDMMHEANKKHIDEKRELTEALEDTRKLLIQKNSNAKNNKKTNNQVLH